MISEILYLKNTSGSRLDAPDNIQWSYYDIDGDISLVDDGRLINGSVIDLYSTNDRVTVANSNNLKALISSGDLTGVDDDGVTLLSVEQTLKKIKIVTEEDLFNAINDSGGGSGGSFDVFNTKFAFRSSQDNVYFFDDGFIKLSWNAPAGYLELEIITKPTNNTNLTSMTTIEGNTSSVYMTQTNFTYRLNSSGLSSNNIMNTVIVAEDSIDYPSYYLNVYNTSSSTQVVIKLEKIFLK